MLRLAQTDGIGQAEPLDSLTLAVASGRTVTVRDGAGREYARLPAAEGEATFTVGGTLGTHTVEVWDEAGQVIERRKFEVDARTRIEDGGRGRELFDLLAAGMRVHREDSVETVMWRGRTYPCFVPRLLDHLHTAKGMQYFSPVAADLAELLRDSQCDDGLIWSFVQNDDGPGYFDTAYGPSGYVRREEKTLFVRPPVENHCEALYVNLISLCWKATGDKAWLAGMLPFGASCAGIQCHRPQPLVGGVRAAEARVYPRLGGFSGPGRTQPAAWPRERPIDRSRPNQVRHLLRRQHGLCAGV